MTEKHASDHKEIRYGAFTISDNVGIWNSDPSVSIKMDATSAVAYREGLWNPEGHEIKTRYATAITGMCIWAKHDCFFHFKPTGKGNPGAKRSLSNVKDRADILRRIHKGQAIDRIRISKDPFGLYQTQMVRWQEEVVKKFSIEKLYYSLPIEEYDTILMSMEKHLPAHFSSKLKEILYSHNAMILDHIIQTIPANVEFIYPMRQDATLTVEDSYSWPYRHLEVDLGIEEMEEIRIPYQARKDGARVPPVLLGMLGFLSPYYEHRAQYALKDYIGLTEEPLIRGKSFVHHSTQA